MPRAWGLSFSVQAARMRPKTTTQFQSKPLPLATRAGFAGASLEPYAWEGVLGEGLPSSS
jgi:hypothetical protein